MTVRRKRNSDPMNKQTECPSCGSPISHQKTPNVTVDIIIGNQSVQPEREIVLIKRKYEPRKWAIPGGYVDYGESLEQAAIREALEETGLHVTLVRQMHAYSDPTRDPRRHNVSVVFIAHATGIPKGADDAEEAQFFRETNLPEDLAFDHRKIVTDYFQKRY